MIQKQLVIEVFKEYFNFSSGHFTIFSRTERENMHGHNFQIHVRCTTQAGKDGLAFDYGLLKRKIAALCESLDERFLLPAHSPHLTLHEEGAYVVASFNGERMPFLRRDVLVLPLANVTLEELSAYFLDNLLGGQDGLASLAVHEVEVKAFSGPGQCVATTWRRPHE